MRLPVSERLSRAVIGYHRCVSVRYRSEHSGMSQHAMPTNGWLGRFRSPRSVVRLIQSLLLIAAIAACGGGGKGSAPPGASVTGTGFAPGTGPGDTQLYFPLAAG